MTFWTEDRITYLRANADRLSASQIADALGCSRNAVIGKAGRLSISLAKTSPPALVTVAALPPPKPIAASGVERGKYKATRPGYFQARCAACGDHTDELDWGSRGKKRAAVILRRHGWRLQGMGVFATWTCADCGGVVAPKPVKSVAKPPAKSIRVVLEPTPIIVSEPKTLVEMGAHCLWPIGDPQDEGFRYCGAPRADFRYCAGHGALSRGGGTPSERQAHKPVKRMYCR